MKICTLILALLSFAASGAIRYERPTPLLHSVLDSPAAMSDGWAGRMSASMASPTEARDYRAAFSKTPPSVWRTRGIVFTAIGGAFLLAGAGVWIYADAESRRQAANGGHVYTLTIYLGAALLGLIGIVFTAIGLPIWLTHLNG